MEFKAGNTPLEQYNHLSNKLYLKREDKNPTGSWKDRATEYKLEKLDENIKEVVLASSGNAAISLLSYINYLRKDIVAHIIVSPNASEQKILKIKELAQISNHEIHFETNAKKKRAELASKGIYIFSSPLDDDYLRGYESLGRELYKTIKGDLASQSIIFCPASSGSGLIGMVNGLMDKIQTEANMPKIIVCQTQSCNPIVNKILKVEDKYTGEKSIADAIVDQSALRSYQVEKIIRETNGSAVTVTNDDLKKASEFMATKGKLNLSWNSLLSIAGYIKMSEGIQNSNIYCIASGL